MELQMETKTSSTTPEPSLIDDDEQSPLIQDKSLEISSQPEPILGTNRSDSSNQDTKLYIFCNIFCTILLLILFFSILLLPIILPLLLINKHQNLTPTFHVDNVSVSSLNLSNCQVFSNWNISFIVRNPEHGHPMFYDALRVLVLYENEYFLSTGNVESFYVRGGQEHVVKAWIGGSSVSVEKWVVSAIEADRHTRKEMNIVVVMEGLVIENPGSEKHRKRESVKGTCNNLKLQLSSADGSMWSHNSRNSCKLKFEAEP